MRYIILLSVLLSAIQNTFSQTVYEKVLIPVYGVYKKSTVYDDDKLNAKLDAEAEKVAKSTKCKDYLIGTAFPYTDDSDCTSGIKGLFDVAVKDSLKWVKIDFNEAEGLSFTLTTRSSNVAKTLTISEQEHAFSFTMLPLCGNDKNQFSEKDSNIYLQLTVKADKSETQHLLFQTFKEAIYFREISAEGDNCKFFTNPLLKENVVNEIYKRMADNVQLVGKIMKEQNDAQNQKIMKDCKYKDKMLYDAMEMTTVEDIKRFLSYCVLRPDIYRRNTWALAEVYATWLVSGMPLPAK
jgi:hypothetical protein